MTSSEKMRFLVFTTLFGVLWGAGEALLGSYLHMVRFPFRGSIMAGMGACIMCVERFYTPRRGASLATAFAALAVKLVSIGGFKLPPLIGMGIEALVVEAVLSVGGLRRGSVALACLLACLEGVPHFFVSNWLMYGSGIFASYMAVIKSMQSYFGLGEHLWKYVIYIWVGVHLAIGLAAGWFTLRVARLMGKL